jgi:hypothetical protein
MGCVKEDGFAVVGRALQLRFPRHLADPWTRAATSTFLRPILLFLMLGR